MNPGTQLPHDENAERAVIGASIVAPDFVLARISDLRPEEFFVPCHRDAWGAVLAVHGSGHPVDVVSLGDYVKREGLDARFLDGFGPWAIAVASDVSQAMNVEYHAGIVRDKATLRKAIELAIDIQARALAGDAAESVTAQARIGVSELEARATGDGPIPITESLGQAIEDIANRCDPESRHLIPTYISTLDERLGGGVAADEMVIVAGRPGMGKTAFADGWALESANVSAAFPVLVFSLEMSRQQMIERILSVKSGIPASHMRSGRDERGQPLGLPVHNQLLDAASSLEGSFLRIDDRHLTLNQILGESRRWHARHVATLRKETDRLPPLGLVVVDYLQLVRVDDPRAFGSREQQVAFISASFKGLAKGIHCPVCVLCQLNRKVEERGGEPMLSDLRESGALEQDADVVIFVHREFDQEDPMARNKDGPAKLIVGKNRSGAVGPALANWIAKTMRFTPRDIRHAGYEGPDTREGPEDWRDR
jgi:replicative DNA helicase